MLEGYLHPKNPFRSVFPVMSGYLNICLTHDKEKDGLKKDMEIAVILGTNYLAADKRVHPFMFE